MVEFKRAISRTTFYEWPPGSICHRNFNKNGKQSVGIIAPKASPKSKINNETLEAVKSHFEANNKSSVREAARELEISKTTVHRYLSEHLEMKAYKVCLSQLLFKVKR